MQRKTAPSGIDIEQSGAFRATIATLNTIDRDGDVTFPNAFPREKEVVVSAYMHKSWDGAMPVGRGVLGSDNRHAWIEGRLFVDTVDGRETYKTLRHLANLAYWSYGYDVKRAARPGSTELRPYPQAKRGLLEIDVHEVSPVLLAAGIGTGAEWIKKTDPQRLATDPEILRLRDEYFEKVLPLYFAVRTAQLP